MTNRDRHLDLRKLGGFVLVAELGSFTKASAVGKIAQSALSRHIHDLESEFGEPLLYRTGHGATLTPFGSDILPRAKALILQARQLTDDIRARQSAPTGQVHLAILASLAPVLLTPLLNQLRRLYPEVQMQILEGLSHHIDEWLVTGHVDLGILYDSRRNRAISDEALFGSCLHLVGRHGSPVFSRGSLSFAKAVSFPLILPGHPNDLRSLIEKHCVEKRLQLKTSFEMDSVSTMKDIVALGDTYTILPLHAVFAEVQKKQLQAVKIVNPSIERQVLLSSSTQRPLSRASREIIRLIREQVAMLPRELKDGYHRSKSPHRQL